MKPIVQIQLPTDASYYGASCPEDRVDGIISRLQSMISREFEDRFDLRFEKTENPRGSGVSSDDGDQETEEAHEVFRFMEEHWTSAL